MTLTPNQTAALAKLNTEGTIVIDRFAKVNAATDALYNALSNLWGKGFANRQINGHIVTFRAKEA